MTELIIENYKIQTTGADGGHNYILTEINYKGKQRKLVILFTDESQEPKLNENKPLKIKGEILDEGIKYDLMMTNPEMEK